MAFGRGEFSAFYGQTTENEPILRERRRWLTDDPSKYLAVLPAASDLVRETIEVALEHKTFHPSIAIPTAIGEAARFLGEHWEPDYLLLKREHDELRLLCGCVCFPSSWALEEKIGLPIEQIHEAVPGLNANIGRQIQTFLEKLKPGVTWLRSNWGLSRSPERNQHPTRKLPRLDASVRLEEVYFRVEEQSLMALPKSNGVLFGIRLKMIPLDNYAGTEDGRRLAQALETMPEPMAVYKGLANARSRLIQLLNG
jgi:hypothetical protein